MATKFNGLSNILDRQGYEHLLDIDDSNAGMMLIELENPVLFGCTSTLLKEDRPGVIGGIQNIFLSGEYSSSKRSTMTTVYMQMLPLIRPTEI